MLALVLCFALLQEPAAFEDVLRSGLQALQSGDLGSASRRLGRASELNPSDGRVWLALAQTRWRLGQKQAALTAAVKSRKLGVGDARILHGLVMFYAAAEQHKDTIQVASDALRLMENPRTRNLLGRAYEATGDHAKAILELQAAIRQDPKMEAYRFDLAETLPRHQNFETAITVLEASRPLFPNSAQLQLALGVAYYGQRRFIEAVDAFLNVLNLAPDAPQPYAFLARILEHADGKSTEILTRYGALAKKNPQQGTIQFLYGKVLAWSGDEAAEAQLRRAVNLDARNWEAHYELGLVLEKKGSLDDAAASLEKSIALNQTAPTPHYRLARVYDRLGKKAQANAERELHAALSAQEKAAMDRHAASVKRLELTVQ